MNAQIREIIENTGTEMDWDSVLSTVLKEFNCMSGTVHLLDGNDGHLHIQAHAGIPEHILPAVEKIPVGKGIAGAAAEKREPVEICNLQSDTSGVAKPAAKDTKVSGSIAVPIEGKDGKLFGTLGIGKYEPYSFSDSEKLELTEIANQLANFLS